MKKNKHLKREHDSSPSEDEDDDPEENNDQQDNEDLLKEKIQKKLKQIKVFEPYLLNSETTSNNNNNNKYALKHVMSYLRQTKKFSEDKIKNELLFTHPYSLKGQEIKMKQDQ